MEEENEEDFSNCCRHHVPAAGAATAQGLIGECCRLPHHAQQRAGRAGRQNRYRWHAQRNAQPEPAAKRLPRLPRNQTRTTSVVDPDRRQRHPAGLSHRHGDLAGGNFRSIIDAGNKASAGRRRQLDRKGHNIADFLDRQRRQRLLRPGDLPPGQCYGYRTAMAASLSDRATGYTAFTCAGAGRLPRHPFAVPALPADRMTISM